MEKEKLGIILEFGFHELKKYIYSDFGKKIAEKYDIVWLALQKNSEEFDRLFRATGYPIYYFNQDDFTKNSKIESYNLSSRRAWVFTKGIGIFHNYRTVTFKGIKPYLIGNTPVVKFFEILTLNFVKRHYFNSKISDFFIENNIQTLLGTGYISAFSKTMYVSAYKAELKCYLLANNWKDLYINNFIPFKFLRKIFVWDDSMKKNYLFQMRYFKPKQIAVTGNPVFDSLRNSKPTKPRHYYASKYKISENAQWIYYTMMSPLLSNDEIYTIVLAGKEILKNYTSKQKVILIRRNPQHNNNDFADIELPANVVLTENFCYFDKGKDMHTQSPEGEQEWIDLLHYCDINFSVPSTVTLEFLTLGKPVLNIGFGPDGKEDSRIRQHFEAGFYRPLFEEKKVSKVMDITGLNNALVNLPLARVREDMKKTTNAADSIIEIMLQSCKK